MPTVGETFTHLMQCGSLDEMAKVIEDPLPQPARLLFRLSDEALNDTYKSSLDGHAYFVANSASEILLINAMRKGDYPNIYTYISSMLFTAILDEAETAFVTLAEVWPVMAFCQTGSKPANVFTLALMGSWNAKAAQRKRDEGGTPADGNMAMFLFRSMSIFHILALRRMRGMRPPDVNLIEVAKEMENNGLVGALDWVLKNS